MILAQLYEHSQRIQDKLPIEGYGQVRLNWLVELRPDGNLKENGFTRLSKDDPKWKLPDVVRASGVKPKLLADNGEYVFGIGRDTSPPDKVAERHRQFKELVQKCADVTREPSVQAVEKFLENWNPERDRAKLPEDFDPSQTFTFKVGNCIPADSIPDMKAVQKFWISHITGSDDNTENLPRMQCLVTGKDGLVEERLPVKIKGIPDGQTAGTSLVSANAGPFTSYGLSNSLTSPISREAGEGFAKALNHLIATKDSRLYLGPVVYTFWTQESCEYSFWDDFNDDQPQEVKNLYESALAGNRIYDEPNRFYALALSASGGRAVVRDWIESSIPVVMQNLVQWFEAQEIVNPFGELGEKPYLSIRRLSDSLYRDPSKEAIAVIPPLFIHSALKGTPLPLSLLTRVVRRICVDRTEPNYPVTHPRAALIKLILTSQGYPMTNMQSLNLNPDLDPQDLLAYHYGRLLAQLEKIQWEAYRDQTQGKGVNATVIDRYYGAASVTPARIMGSLVKDAQAHLSKLRRNSKKYSAYLSLQEQLEEILSHISPKSSKAPKSLSMQQQSIFALGYYHQRAASREAAIAASNAKKEGQNQKIETVQSNSES
jgi:CRISPR-associated protein Csd1